MRSIAYHGALLFLVCATIFAVISGVQLMFTASHAASCLLREGSIFYPYCRY